MILTNEFSVNAPLQSTWDALLAVDRVAGCLPGAEMDPVGEDGTYRGRLKPKVGPMRMTYQGTVRLHEVDEEACSVAYEAAAREAEGPGTAAATIRVQLQPESAGTHVRVETTLNVTGRAAQFGRGIMENVADTMLGTFSVGLQQQLTAQTPEAISPDSVAAAHPTQPPSQRGDRRPDEVLDVTPALRSVVPARRVVLAAVLAGALAAFALSWRRRRRVDPSR